jgi:hypothetical protein
MKHLLVLIISTFIGFNAHSQCLYGIEHTPNTSGNSIIIIHKYGFPSGVQHHLHSNTSGTLDYIDTIISNNDTDTLIFSAFTDTLESFRIDGITPGGDTIAILSAGGVKLPKLLTLKRYVSPSTISSTDGVIVLNKLNNGSSSITTSWQIGTFGTVQEHPDSTVITNLSQGGFAGYYFEDSTFRECYFAGTLGNPFIWSDFYADSITCPVGINMASNTSICDGEAYVASVQNGVAPYTYDWNLNGVFTNDTLDTLLCTGNHMVIIKDQNDQTRNCAFSIGSLDNSYIPPAQSYDTIIHNYTEYCIDPNVDSVSLIGSEFIDSLSASIVWSFYDDSILIDQLLDTIYFSVPNPTYTNISIYLHLTCNGDTLKSTESVFSIAGYLPFPFNETGFLGSSKHSLLDIVLFPNPAENSIQIQSLEKIKRAIFINTQGRIEKFVTEINSSINISDLSKGLYFVHLYDIKGNKYVRRITKL